MDIFPTIVSEVVAQAKRSGVALAAPLVTLYLRSQLLHGTGRRDLSGNVEVRPETIDALVRGAVDVLTTSNGAFTETLRLQGAIAEQQQAQVAAFRTDRVQHKAKSHRFMEEVCSKRDGSDAFHAIVLYILHESRLLGGRTGAAGGQGSPDTSALNNTSVNTSGQGAKRPADVSQRETMAALESVFPRQHMDRFVPQRDAEKEVQLEEIGRIVWGIRLFNRANGKGGDDIPHTLEDAEAELAHVTTAAEDLQAAMGAVAAKYAAVLRSPSLRLSEAQRVQLRDEYHHRLQILVYTRSLLETLLGVEAKLTEFRPKWEASIEDARQLVKGSEASPVPKVNVYMKFIVVTERWDVLLGLAREVRDAAELFGVISESAACSAAASTLHESDAAAALSSQTQDRRPNKQLLAAEIASLPSASGGAVEYLPNHPRNEATGHFRTVHFEFNGFCIVSFIDQGMLLAGRTEDTHEDADAGECPGYVYIGANNAFYTFFSDRALRAFARDPFRYLSQGLMELVKATPTTVFLLGLHQYLPKEAYLAGTRQVEAAASTEKSDGATQTGQIDPYKDTHYVWNEWELRRLALQLAALRTKRTKSSQTALSHFRRENDTQAYPPKAQETQTGLDAAIQPPRVRQYIKGLRGSDSSEIEVIKKTFLY